MVLETSVFLEFLGEKFKSERRLDSNAILSAKKAWSHQECTADIYEIA